MSDELPVASLSPLRATASPSLTMSASALTTTVPSTPTERSRSWMIVLDASLPMAVASPLHTQAKPSETLDAVPLLAAVSGPATVTVTSPPLSLPMVLS